MILEILKSAAFSKVRAQLYGFGRENTLNLILENLKEEKVSQSNRHYYEVSLNHNDPILLNDLLIVLHGQYPFEHAVITAENPHAIEIPASAIDNYNIDKNDNASKFIEKLSDQRINFNETCTWVTVPEVIPHINHYINKNRCHSDTTPRHNINIIFLAMIMTKNVHLNPDALAHLPQMHTTFRTLLIEDQLAICCYLLYELENKQDSTYHFLRIYVARNDMAELLEQAYLNKVNLNPISMAEFIYLINRFWPSWPDAFGDAAIKYTGLFRYYFTSLSSKDKAKMTIAKLNPINFNILYNWHIDKQEFLEQLRSDHHALLHEALEKVNGNEFSRIKLEQLNAQATHFINQFKLKQHAKSNKLAQLINLLIPTLQSNPLSTKDKFKLYYIMKPYMQYYSNYGILGQRSLTKRIQPFYDILEADLEGTLALYQLVNPNIDDIAKVLFDSAVSGASTQFVSTFSAALKIETPPLQQTRDLNSNNNINKI